MGCKEVGHKHNWPTEGTLVIQRCEIRCNFCPGAKGLKPWKYAWFLRRHVRAMHCTPGRGKTPYRGLEVAITWKDKGPNTNKKSKSRKRTSRGQIKDEIKNEIKDEDASSSEAESPETEGMAAPGQRSVGKNWIDQPAYADVPNQHPGETGGFTTVSPQDLNFGQDVVFADDDDKNLMDADDILNYNDIGAFLDAQSFVQFIDDDEDVPLTRGYDNMDIVDGDDDTVKVAPKTADVVAKRHASRFNLNNDGDTVPVTQDHLEFAEADFFSNDRCYMSDFSDGYDSDDYPLAATSRMAHSGNTCRPPGEANTAKLLPVYQLATQTMLKQGLSPEQMMHALQKFIDQGTEAPAGDMQAMGTVMEIDT